MVIQFAKARPNAVIPTKRDEDGCYDLYACLGDEEAIIIPPGEVRLIPTGLRSAFDKGYRIGLRERGSNAKNGLATMAGQIDSGYNGEWFVALHNVNPVPVILHSAGHMRGGCGSTIYLSTEKAIAQFAVEAVPESEIVEVDEEVILNRQTERGEGCLGSSGK